MAYKKKGNNGGKRAGAGRKRKNAPRITYSIDMTPHQAELLRKWGGGDISAGLRWLIDSATPLVGPAQVVLTCSTSQSSS